MCNTFYTVLKMLVKYLLFSGMPIFTRVDDADTFSDTTIIHFLCVKSGISAAAILSIVVEVLI